MPIDPNIPLSVRGVEVQTPFQTLAQVGQLRAQRQDEAMRAQQMEAGGLEIEQRRGQMDSAKRAAFEDQQLRQLFSRGESLKPTELYSIVGVDRGNKILQGFAALQGEQLKTADAVRGFTGSMAGAILALPEPMRAEAWTTARESALTRGLKPEDVPEQYPGPEGLTQLQRWALSPKEQVEAAQPKLTNVAPGGVVIDERNPQAGPVYTAPVEEKKYAVTVPGPQGQPIQRLVTEAEMLKGVPAYRDPKTSATEKAKFWILRDGKPMRVTETEYQAGDTPYRAPQSTTETAQDRQRKGRLESARGFLTRLNELRDNINTKMGPEAGLTGMVRQGKAAIGLDPDVAEYERVRAAGGRALAVAIMGAQNLSDADAAAWSNMLPGARIDAVTAKRLTDQIGRMLEETDTTPTAAAAATTPKTDTDPLGLGIGQ